MLNQKNAKALIIKVAVVLLTIVALLLLFDYYIAPLINVKPTVRSNMHILFALAAVAALIYILKDLSKVLDKYLGPHLANLVTFIFEIVIVTVGTLVILSILRVSLTTLLVSGGIAAIVIGLAISTLASNLISGAFIYAAFPIKVGDRVFINNIPGKINKITTIYTSIETEGGTELVIPNSALVQGYFLIAKGQGRNGRVYGYRIGDRVSVPSLNLGGKLEGLDDFVAEIQTQKGRLIVPAYSLLTGGLFMAKQPDETSTFTIKVNRNADKVRKALEEAGARVDFNSMDGEDIEFLVSFKSAPEKEQEVKSRLIALAYETQKGKEAA